MSGAAPVRQMSKESAVSESLTELAYSARQIASKEAGLQVLASSAEGRAKVVEMRDQYRQWHAPIAETNRALVTLDAVFARILSQVLA